MADSTCPAPLCDNLSCEVPAGYCHCGCGAKTNLYVNASRGRVAGRPAMWLRGHHRRKSPVDYIIDGNGCWVWQLGGRSRGYPVKYVGRKDGKSRAQRAHRYYYEQHVGPIPEGMQLDHLCRNTMCVNPAHLEPVTSRENLMRGQTVPARKAAQTHCIHGHEFDADNTYITPSGGFRACRACKRIRIAERRARGE